MSGEKICPNCGSSTISISKFCQNCGAIVDIKDKIEKNISEVSVIKVKSSQKQIDEAEFMDELTHDFASQKNEDDNKGLTAFIFGILAFIGLIPFISSMIAIGIGNSSNNTLGKIGILLGWISLVITLAVIIVVIIFSWWKWR